MNPGWDVTICVEYLGKEVEIVRLDCSLIAIEDEDHASVPPVSADGGWPCVLLQYDR